MSFTVKFVNGTEISQRTVCFGEIVGTTPNPTKTGYTLENWHTSDGTIISKNSIVTQNIICYPKWSPVQYTITYNLNGRGTLPYGFPNTYTIESSTITPSSISNVTGYTFNGWTPKSIPHGSTGDKVFNAIWDIVSFKVQFVNGNSVNEKTVEYNGFVGETPTPTNNGYEFQEWQTEDGTTITEDTVVTQDIVCHPIWNPISYSIAYDMNGHGENPSSNPTSYTVESEDIVPANPSNPEGYTFINWTPSSIPSGSTGDRTFTANWNINTYTVTYDGNDGTSSKSSEKVNYNGTVSSIPTGTRIGYTLVGWYTEKEGGTQLTASTKITQDTTFYAHWQANIYTITWDSQGGSTVESWTRNYGTTLGTLPVPTKDDNTFDGWYTESTNGDKIDETETVTVNATYYAHWNKIPITITFNSNGGTL